MIELDELPAEAPSPLASDDRFFVYEAWNAVLRELVIGVGDSSPRKMLPECVSHWRPEHSVTVKIIESLLPQDDAILFARLYGEHCAARDVRVFLEVN